VKSERQNGKLQPMEVANFVNANANEVEVWHQRPQRQQTDSVVTSTKLLRRFAGVYLKPAESGLPTRCSPISI
jgi:hypothetical protein